MVGITPSDLREPELARLSFCDAIVDAKNIPGVINLDGVRPLRDGDAMPGAVIGMRHDNGTAELFCHFNRFLDRHALRYVPGYPQYDEVPGARRNLLSGN